MMRAVMPRIAGETRSFRCECGANVFRSPEDEPLVFICNGCDARYIGTPCEEANDKLD